MRRRRTPEVIGGRVNTDGTILGGDGFTCQKTGTGVYVITGPRDWRVVSAAASLNAVAAAFTAVTDYVDNKFTIRVYVWNAANTPGDGAVSFVAVGVQQ